MKYIIMDYKDGDCFTDLKTKKKPFRKRMGNGNT